MEQVIATRTGKNFAKAADQDGEVISVKPDGIIVRYADGSEVGYPTGTVYGHSGALTFPHPLTSNVKLSEKFEKGKILTYNTNFFEKDYLNPDGVCWRNATPVMVALMECPETYEDSSSISRKIAGKLTTSITKIRSIVVNFDQALHQVLKPGQRIESEDLLCIIEDSATSGTDLFDEQTIDTLRALSKQTPSANSPGIIDRIEVLYNGEKEDMSPTLFELAQESDRIRARIAKSQNQPVFTGQVDDNYRVDNNSLLPDTAVINFYITGQVPMVTGDKGVFGNQLKTVVGEVMEDPLHTESGVEVDAKFGSISVGNRGVGSPYLMGTTSILMKIVQRKMIEAYRGKL